MDPGAHAPGYETEKTGPRANIQEGLSFQVIDGKKIPQRPLRLGDAALVYDFEESIPVLAEPEALTACYFVSCVHLLSVII